MQNWRYLFEDKILARGISYTDRVEITHKDGEKVTAVVKGTENYNAEIRFDEGLIDEMHCSCPYFEINNCKHLAALLYVLEDDGKKTAVKKDDFKKLFDSVSDDDLREFLLGELEDNLELRNKFKLKFSNELDSEYYKSKLSQICHKKDNRAAINAFLSKDMHFLMDKREYELVFDLLKDIFPLIKNWWNYWEDFGSDGNMEKFTGIVEMLIPTYLHDEVFKWLGDLIYAVPDVDHMDDLVELYFMEFQTTEELKAKEKISWKLYEKTQNIIWVRVKIDLMEEIGYSPKEIDEFRNDYISHEMIMEQYIDSSHGSKKEELLKKAIEMFDYTRDYEIQLKDYYLSCGDSENYMIELEKIVMKYPKVSYFKEFKENYTGNWPEKRQEIFDRHCDNVMFLNECYAEEGMYDLLIENINHKWDLDRYRELLVSDYSDELIEKYIQLAILKAQKSGGPKQYEDITDILKTIYNLPQGKDRAIEIAEYFKIRYRLEPRVLEAVRNAGF